MRTLLRDEMGSSVCWQRIPGLPKNLHKAFFNVCVCMRNCDDRKFLVTQFAIAAHLLVTASARTARTLLCKTAKLLRSALRPSCWLTRANTCTRMHDENVNVNDDDRDDYDIYGYSSPPERQRRIGLSYNRKAHPDECAFERCAKLPAAAAVAASLSKFSSHLCICRTCDDYFHARRRSAGTSAQITCQSDAVKATTTTTTATK